tara:strand:+ start:209 stop:1468 length:1260 start_codon:yes stop_codon:yes gene_type:complete
MNQHFPFLFFFFFFPFASSKYCQSLFAVFDGHAGDYTARFLESHFVIKFNELLTTNLPNETNGSPDEKIIESTLRDTCLTLNEQLARDPRMARQVSPTKTSKMTKTSTKESTTTTKKSTASEEENEKEEEKGPVDDPASFVPKQDTAKDTEKEQFNAKKSIQYEDTSEPMDGSGACGVIVVVTVTHLIIVHVGDCRCVLVRGDADNDDLLSNVELLTSDHTCSNREDEKNRILNAGGFVHPVSGRIGVTKNFDKKSIEPSRSWGDFLFRNSGVICLPETRIIEREPDGMELLILGCDGIFEGKEMTSKNIVNILINNAKCIEKIRDAPKKLAAHLAALEEAALEEKKSNSVNDGVTLSSLPSTPKSNVSHVTLIPTEDEICLELRNGCEAVMLKGLDNGCMDNQTMCVALLRSSTLRPV